jgi:hypothetical protein
VFYEIPEAGANPGLFASATCWRNNPPLHAGFSTQGVGVGTRDMVPEMPRHCRGQPLVVATARRCTTTILLHGVAWQNNHPQLVSAGLARAKDEGKTFG